MSSETPTVLSCSASEESLQEALGARIYRDMCRLSTPRRDALLQRFWEMNESILRSDAEPSGRRLSTARRCEDLAIIAEERAEQVARFGLFHVVTCTNLNVIGVCMCD